MGTLAINWEPQIRGVIIIIIAVGVLMGSVYLILATNLGARLGFLVAFAALAGWIFLMGTVWWTYGKGLLGPDPSWQPVRAKTVLQTTTALSEAGILKTPVADDGTMREIREAFRARYVRLLATEQDRHADDVDLLPELQLEMMVSVVFRTIGELVAEGRAPELPALLEEVAEAAQVFEPRVAVTA